MAQKDTGLIYELSFGEAIRLYWRILEEARKRPFPAFSEVKFFFFRIHRLSDTDWNLLKERVDGDLRFVSRTCLTGASTAAQVAEEVMKKTLQRELANMCGGLNLGGELFVKDLLTQEVEQKGPAWATEAEEEVYYLSQHDKYMCWLKTEWGDYVFPLRGKPFFNPKKLPPSSDEELQAVIDRHEADKADWRKTVPLVEKFCRRVEEISDEEDLWLSDQKRDPVSLRGEYYSLLNLNREETQGWALHLYRSGKLREWLDWVAPEAVAARVEARKK